jgi:hypothetical protein
MCGENHTSQQSRPENVEAFLGIAVKPSKGFAHMTAVM